MLLFLRRSNLCLLSIILAEFRFFKELINKEKEAKLHPSMDIASERDNFEKMLLTDLKEYLKA